MKVEIYEAQITLRFPAIHAPVFKTPKGVHYLKEPGVVALGLTATNLAGTKDFLDGFDSSLQFGKYLEDPVELPHSERLSKFSGQLCYMAFGEKRSWNKDAGRYLTNIKAQAHGSVFEHPNISFLLYGLSRSQTHEAVRHRAGFGYSQLSQRYVDGKALRFVERPEFQGIPKLHDRFESRIERLAEEYELIAETLIENQQAGATILSAEAKTGLRKKVNQAARAALPNETEAPIVVTGNVRAWRHFLEMRASEHAETEIRRLGFRIFLCLKEIAPLLFEDYKPIKLDDGTDAVRNDYRKV